MTTFETELVKCLVPLARYAKKLAKAEWEDLRSQVIVHMIEKQHKFVREHDGSLLHWGSQIMRNLFIDNTRRVTRFTKYKDMANSPRSVEPCALARIQVAEVLGTIAGMPQGQRDVVLLRAQDTPYGQIQEQLALPAGTVKSRIYRAKIQLVEEGHQ